MHTYIHVHTHPHKHTHILSLAHTLSMSSDEDEENSARRPRELQTGSSDEEDRSPTGRAALYHAKIPSIARNEQESDTMEIDETIGKSLSLSRGVIVVTSTCIILFDNYMYLQLI